MKNFKNFINKIGIIFFMTLALGNLCCVEGYAATVGEQLTQPEAGWKRYDDTDSNISYINGSSNWTKSSNVAEQYMNTYTAVGGFVSQNCSNCEIRFNFIGSKLRIIGYNYNQSYRSNKIEISIDNKIVEYFSQDDNITTVCLNYEKNNLDEIEHCVKIKVINLGGMVLDAIDIDENGELKPYNPDVISQLNLFLNKTSTTLNVGQSETLIATIAPENTTNKKIVWKSKNPNIATVDQNGKVTAVTPGSAIIVAKIEGTDITASCTVNVKEVESSRAILNVTMTNGTIKEYDLSMTEINDFINWFNGRAEGKGTISHCINKNANIKPFTNRKEYLVFDKIYSFEVNQYEDK